MTSQAEKIAKSSKSDEWTTPIHIINTIQDFYWGTIDLDPATTPDNPTNATEFFTKEINGLTKHWHGDVFLNPPFSQMEKWVNKAVLEACKQGVLQLIMLTKLDARTAWYNRMMTHADAFCIVRGYVNYGNSPNSALFTTQLTYFGDKPEEFVKHFDKLGYAFKL